MTFAAHLEPNHAVFRRFLLIALSPMAIALFPAFCTTDKLFIDIKSLNFSIGLQMKRQTKYLLTGVTLAGLILLGGYLRLVYDDSQLSSLIDKCNIEAVQAQAQASNGGRFVCDPYILKSLGVDDNRGIQKTLVESLSESGRTFNEAKLIALLVLLLFGSPYAWYFLLDRIRELRNAVAGKIN